MSVDEVRDNEHRHSQENGREYQDVVYSGILYKSRHLNRKGDCVVAETGGESWASKETGVVPLAHL